MAPQAVPTAVRTTVTGLPTTAATMATGIGGGAASGLSSGGLAAALARGGVSEDTLTKAGMGVHQAQSINTAGLSMLAAVGARQQQEQQLIQQVTTQQSTPAKVYMWRRFCMVDSLEVYMCMHVHVHVCVCVPAESQGSPPHCELPLVKDVVY